MHLGPRRFTCTTGFTATSRHDLILSQLGVQMPVGSRPETGPEPICAIPQLSMRSIGLYVASQARSEFRHTVGNGQIGAQGSSLQIALTD